MPYEFRMPDVGEGIAEAEIVRWLVGQGDTVRLDQPIVEIETDKAVVEVPSPVAGVVSRQGGNPGDMLHVGDVLAVFETEAGAQSPAVETQAPETPKPTQSDGHTAALSSARRPLATPAVRRLARELKVDLQRVTASGPGGRITAEDVQAASGGREAATRAEVKEEPAAPAARAGLRPAPAAIAPSGEDERAPLRGLRRRIAESMAQSWSTIPHITGMDEVEVSALVMLRERLKERFEQQGVHLSYLPLIVKAVVAGLKQYPIVNAALDEAAGEIVYRHRYNIGIATATPDGLIVPVVHDADRKSMIELAREIHELSEQARARTIPLASLQDGSFTITNFGSLGGWLGTPIIRPGEAAILGVGRIQDRPWIVNGQVAVRPVLALSFAADHRLIDGDVSTSFVRTLTGYLNDPLSLFAELV
jgi:pyruvate dehydrogenase E2 component (dihydrolipoyllysine-residue acetyltransferase)